MHLLFPPTCRGCGERFDIFSNPDPLPLCSGCLARWATAKTASCVLCGEAIGTCHCMPTMLREAGCAALVKAVGYHPSEKCLPEGLILRCKRVRDRALFRFFAADMQLPLWQTLDQTGDTGNVVVTYIPRRPRAIAEQGVDQACELARALGRALEIPTVRALKNCGREEQKLLDHAARAQNAQAALRSYGERTKRAVEGKTVILTDDITTAGATLAVATRLLLSAGAQRVICCVVGVTVTDVAEKNPSKIRVE